MSGSHTTVIWEALHDHLAEVPPCPEWAEVVAVVKVNALRWGTAQVGDRETYPHEFERGGFIWGSTREISEDDVVACFVFEGEVTSMLWADQAFPMVGDLLEAEAVGLDGDLFEVIARVWRTPNLLMIGIARREDS